MPFALQRGNMDNYVQICYVMQSTLEMGSISQNVVLMFVSYNPSYYMSGNLPQLEMWEHTNFFAKTFTNDRLEFQHKVTIPPRL